MGTETLPAYLAVLSLGNVSTSADLLAQRCEYGRRALVLNSGCG